MENTSVTNTTSSAPYDFSGLTNAFKSLMTNGELVFQIFDLFPIAIEVFAPDGTSIYMNRAGLEMNNIKDASLLIGKYNLFHDPVCRGIMGDEPIDRAFRGESVFYPDFPAPIQDVLDRGVIDEKPWEAATMDILMQPVWDGDKFLCTICWFIVKHIYQGRPEVALAKKYIDENWLEPFNVNAVAEAVHVSPNHLGVLFRQNAGMTLNDYYKKVKVDHIKEKLRDTSLNVTEVFDFCGADRHGAVLSAFKETTGMTPTEYRESLK